MEAIVRILSLSRVSCFSFDMRIIHSGVLYAVDFILEWLSKVSEKTRNIINYYKI
jgi:hypothetical protein